MKGFATLEGTAAYKARFVKEPATDLLRTLGSVPELYPGHFRLKNNLWFSSIGIGSYLGEPDAETDRLYQEALKEALLSGINVIDSAINYRCQQSERAFGKALCELIREGKIKREEVIVCTKGGFIPFDGDYPADSGNYIKKTYVETGILKPDDLAQGCHAMSPSYLEDQLQRSLTNLGLETIDIYYLHNPETQLEDIDRPAFLGRMRRAFEWFEKKVVEGKIQMYGTATWSGYRVPREEAAHLSMEELTVIAREAGGPSHHFKSVQLPFNLAMPEAWILPNQSFGGNLIPFLGVAEKYGMTVVGSASLLQAKLTRPLPEQLVRYFKPLQKSSQQSLQFARSVSGMTTSLVGMKSKAHVQENLETSKVPPLTEEQLFSMFHQAE